METTSRLKPPVWYWVLSILALLWNMVGVLAYLKHAYMSDEDFGKLSEAERLLYDSQPVWVTAAFAVAVWSGALGCVALLLRKKWAHPVLLLSLIAIIVQNIYAFFMSDHFEVYGPSAIVMPILIITIGILLVLFARMGRRQSWIS